MTQRQARIASTIAALPANPNDWDAGDLYSFQAARDLACDDTRRLERVEQRKQDDRRAVDTTAAARALADRTPPPAEVEPLLKTVVDQPWTEHRAKAHVRKRSGGVCELQGPTCLHWAHDVDHVCGRKGPDPWNPDGLLHLCGFGNAGGGCHQWVSQRTMGRAASIYVVERIAEGSL